MSTGGRSFVGVKLVGLVAVSALVIALSSPVVSITVAAAAVLGAIAARAHLASWRRLAVPVLVMVLLVGALQLATATPRDGLVAATRLLAIGLLAVTFTLTTPATAIVAAAERTLTLLRVRSDRVFRMGLLVGLTTRGVDHLGHVAARVLDARRARGLQRSARAFAVPMVVEAARFAHGVGEALDARGVTPPDDHGGASAEPYRFVHGVERETTGRGTARWRPLGDELGPVAERPDHVPPFLVVEAMAQCAGLTLAARADAPAARWLLLGIDDAEVRPARWDQVVELAAVVVRDSGRTGRLLVSARQDGDDLGVATVLMATSDTVPGAERP